jgi:hypothetical protein
MAIYKSIPSIRIINGREIRTSDNAIVSSPRYRTSGESCIIVKDIPEAQIILDETNTDHLTIKSITKTIIQTNLLIDDKFKEIELGNESSVELKFVMGGWYILSSDGLKEEDLSID